jgi:quercetin dioxygenase-like cupin family protein
MATYSYGEAALWSDKDSAWHEVMPGVHRRIATYSLSGMMVYYRIAPNTLFPLHTHPHAQYGIFLEGEGTFKVGQSTWQVKKGDAYYIPPGVPHELRTGQRQCLIIDFFTPMREDMAAEASAPDAK